MRFVVDAQLPPALAEWLIAQGHDAIHVVDLGYARAPDSRLWDHASETNSVIGTKGEDFALRVQLRPSGPRSSGSDSENGAFGGTRQKAIRKMHDFQLV